jgi:hypothetical protein
MLSENSIVTRGTGCLPLLLAVGLAGCDGRTCGEGTVEKGGICVAADDYLKCGAGFVATANRCDPIPEWKQTACGPNTKWDKDKGLCVGTGTVEETCTKQCPAAQGGKICLAGKVLEGASLLAHAAGSPDKPVPLTPASGVTLKIFDPIAFVTNPTGTPPLATAAVYNTAGCWIVEGIDIPFTNLFAIAIDDSEASKDLWAFGALGHTPTFGQNSINIEVPAIKAELAQAWGRDLLKQGSMFAWFVDAAGKAVAGVTPTFEGKPPPWDGMDVMFMNKDLKAPYFDDAAKATTASGLVVVRKALVKAFSGTKAGCTVESGLGGSTPGAFFFRVYDLTGC